NAGDAANPHPRRKRPRDSQRRCRIRVRESIGIYGCEPGARHFRSPKRTAHRQLNHDEEVDVPCDPFRRTVSGSGSKEFALSAEVYFALSTPASRELVAIVRCAWDQYLGIFLAQSSKG